MLYILAIPILIIATLLFLSGWKKSAFAVVFAPLVPAVALMLALNSNQNPEIGEGVKSVDWLPPKATDISFIRSYSFTAYEFTIDEAGFKAYAESRDWPISEFNGKKEVARYLRAFEAIGRPANPNDYYAEISKGYFYDHRQSNGGGITVIYNPENKRAYVTHSPR